MSVLDDILQRLESSWTHEQQGTLWRRWATDNRVNAQKLKAYWAGPLDAVPPVVTSEYGLARLEQMVAHHTLKRGVLANQITITPGPISAVSYDSLTDWDKPAADLALIASPTRNVPFTTAVGLQNALTAMAAGDYIHYTGSGGFTITSTSWEYFQNHNPASLVVVDLGLPASADHVTIQYTGSNSGLVAVYSYNMSNLHIYGGEINTTSSGGSGINFHGPMSNVYWWDFYVHDTGGDAIDLFNSRVGTNGANGIITGCSFRGEVENWGLNLANDPHLPSGEAGTGWHGLQCCDTSSTDKFTDNVIALYGHDSACGALMQWGQPVNTDLSGNTIYLKADTLTKVATSQVAANALQIWSDTGYGDYGDSVVGWVEGTNLQGRCVDMQGLGGSHRSIATDLMVVDHGRATNTNQNSHLGSTEPGVDAAEPYDDRGSITYTDCT